MSYPEKGQADYYAEGDWNAVCSICGNKRKASYLVKNWMGMWRCPEHNDPRQPQDFVRGVPDKMNPPWTQPEGTPIFVVSCTPNGNTAYPGYAIPGCVKPNYVSPFFDPNIDEINTDDPTIAVTALVTGNMYQIVTLGNTNWADVGYIGFPITFGTFTATGAGVGTGLVVLF